jgi:IS5 family transposase
VEILKRLPMKSITYSASCRTQGCWLQGAVGDPRHALCCAAGYNIRWLMRAIVRLGLRALFCALFTLAVYVAGLLGALTARPKAAGANASRARDAALPVGALGGAAAG